jgi:hypothetical protein
MRDPSGSTSVPQSSIVQDIKGNVRINFGTPSSNPPN